ncbi:tetratricopeptide repeat protein [Tsuneonella sp. YG55]|uniref:Tetratricopeptide repeat protein n=1 Tax=Tsuneonella litorea TaxID=2976475 RepID=A0A9X2W2K7_9SPHN|nr:tetratricopeptide repeat protein [Tsuneonella litorea]MCT2559671.1 tetratricopeptide repeat protein [Tsuneonella litorea]
MTEAAVLASRAAALAANGDDAGASIAFEEALKRFPGDPRLFNSAGNFHAEAGRAQRALEMFERALAIDPRLHEAAKNAAITLQGLGRVEEAIALLRTRERDLGRDASYWTLRANAEQQAGRLPEAGNSFARAITIDGADPDALKGRARVSLERGEARAVEDYERALARNPGDPYLVRDYAYALHEAGLPSEARTVAELLVEGQPGWPEALGLLASLRWAAGEGDRFDDHFAQAADRAASPDVHLAWADTLSGIDRPARAAEVLAVARGKWPGDARLALAEAVALGESGAAERAEAAFSTANEPPSPEWAVERTRNLLRLGRPEAAETLLGPVAEADLGNVAAWALRDLCWRATGDARHRWLHGQDGLIRTVPLALPGHDRVRDLLDRIHARSARPIGQSVKDGSQTRGALFARAEPEIALIERAILSALETYRSGLPPADARHPLLAFRDAPWKITGSWSILLQGEGHHAAHVHPLGVISSAAYFSVPAEVDEPERPGWLELGRPPPSLGIDLGPLAVVRPREGTCVLFPSTLFHGTRPIGTGRRMTVAFDVTA